MWIIFTSCALELLNTREGHDMSATNKENTLDLMARIFIVFTILSAFSSGLNLNFPWEKSTHCLRSSIKLKKKTRKLDKFQWIINILLTSFHCSALLNHPQKGHYNWIIDYFFHYGSQKGEKPGKQSAGFTITLNKHVWLDNQSNEISK